MHSSSLVTLIKSPALSSAHIHPIWYVPHHRQLNNTTSSLLPPLGRSDHDLVHVLQSLGRLQRCSKEADKPLKDPTLCEESSDTQFHTLYTILTSVWRMPFPPVGPYPSPPPSELVIGSASVWVDAAVIHLLRRCLSHLVKVGSTVSILPSTTYSPSFLATSWSILGWITTSQYRFSNTSLSAECVDTILRVSWTWCPAAPRGSTRSHSDSLPLPSLNLRFNTLVC